MKLISLNIENNRHTETVFNFLKKEQADIICLQEFLEEDFNLYKRELNYDGVYQSFKYLDYKFGQDLIGKKHGVAIFAKNIVDSGYVFYNGNQKNIEIEFQKYITDKNLQKNNCFVWVNIQGDNNTLLKFITTHLPVTKEEETWPYKEGESTAGQLEVLDLLFKKLDMFGEFVLCGDMNAPRGRETFTRLSKRYKDNIPAIYKTSIDQNLHRVKGLQLMVDGLFTTPTYEVLNVKLVDGISDHMAIIADINKN